MEYFAGLDISMKETHICVMDRDGKVDLETIAPTSSAANRGRVGKGADGPTDRLRDRAHGNDALSRSCGTGPARRVH